MSVKKTKSNTKTTASKNGAVLVYSKKKKAEKKLKESEMRYKSLIEATSDLVWEFDENEVFTFCSDAYKKLLGYNPKELVGKSAYSIMPKEEVSAVKKEFAKIKKKLKPFSEFINKNVTKEGKVLILESRGVPVFDSKGKNLGFCGVDKDISEKIVAETKFKESEKKFRSLYNSSMDAIMVLEPGNGFLSCNPAAIKMFGFKNEKEFISKTPADISPEFQSDGESSDVKAQKMMSVAMENGSHFFEWVHKRKNGEIFFTDVLLTRVEVKGKNILQATVRDVSERKMHEEELKESVIELEKMNELMIGRELKMMELKEEIKKLKK